MNTIHTTTQRGARRTVTRANPEPIFDANVTERLAYSALAFRCDTFGEEARVFAQAIAVFEWNDIPL
jgi:hypothetical protein